MDGAIAASAPIWQLADTVRRESLDLQAVAISRGVSAAGGATDMCHDNLRAAWPLLKEAGRTPRGLFLLSESVNSCGALQGPDDILEWAQRPFFFMAEGNCAPQKSNGRGVKAFGLRASLAPRSSPRPTLC